MIGDEVRYYDPDGKPMDLMEWAAFMDAKHTARCAAPNGESRPEDDPTRIGSDHLDGDVWVSTVWLGLDHNLYRGGPPLIFETMIFGGDHNEEQWRYSTKEQAKTGHDRVVAALRAGKDPDA